MSRIEAGTVIKERYQILSILGKGGMATVFEANDLKENTAVALKFLNADQATSTKRKERFLREYEILNSLKHPSIVKSLDQDETPEGIPFFSMEIIKGKTLADEIKSAIASKVITQTDFTNISLNILREVANALNYIHKAGYIYCDLKPANIIRPFSEDDKQPNESKIKIIDFGISRKLNQQDPNAAPNMVGTSYYMSPEQIRSEPLAPTSDIYSFGVLAFELLTGNVPFASDALFAVTASHLIGKVPLANSVNHSVPSSIDRMIQICMEKNPGDRYENMDEIIDRLNLAISNETSPSIMTKIFKRLGIH